MTDQEAKNLTGLADHLGGKLISSLPAQFLILVLLNLIFIIGLLWFMDQREKQRERIFGPYIANCEKQVPIDALMQVLQHLKDVQK